METLFTPWRYAYITGREKRSDGCFFCAAGREPDAAERLVVHVTEHHVVLLNRHPYSSGHLMIAPVEHIALPEQASLASQRELWPLVLRCRAVLEGAYQPDGMNVGMNVGQGAGAGVPDHFHVHLVPRWQGDTSFITVVGETRLVPEDLLEARRRLRTLFVGEAV